MAGSGLGPIGVGVLEDATGSCTVPFTITAVLTYVAAIAVLFARPAKSPAPTGAPLAEPTVAGGE
jgi:cyanate permease